MIKTGNAKCTDLADTTCGEETRVEGEVQ